MKSAHVRFDLRAPCIALRAEPGGSTGKGVRRNKVRTGQWNGNGIKKIEAKGERNLSVVGNADGCYTRIRVMNLAGEKVKEGNHLLSAHSLKAGIAN